MEEPVAMASTDIIGKLSGQTNDNRPPNLTDYLDWDNVSHCAWDKDRVTTPFCSITSSRTA